MQYVRVCGIYDVTELIAPFVLVSPHSNAIQPMILV